MEHLLKTTLELPLSIEKVFAFFADAANLERITPPQMNFHILTPLPIQIELGTLIEYRLRLFGVPMGWTTRISGWDPPRQFTDEQLRGPYALWVHTHDFEQKGEGTVIRDQVRYRLPLPPLGEIAYPVVRYQLGRIFSYRQRAVREALLGT